MIFVFSPGYCKWMGLFFGFATRRFAGAIVGFIVGAFIDSLFKRSSTSYSHNEYSGSYDRDAYASKTQSSALRQAYDELGVSPDATDQELRAAYKRLAILYHPDRVNNLSEDVRREAERKLKRINEARDRIWRSRGIK